MQNFVLGFLFLMNSSHAGSLISVTVGQVRDQILTSREVNLHQIVEKALYSSPKDAPSLLDVDSQAFARETSALLMEWVVYLEAKNIQAVGPSNKEIDIAIDKVKELFKAHPQIAKLKPSEKEIRFSVERKLQSKKFVQFKADTSVIPVTDIEAQAYFDQNRQRFGTLPFEHFRENIKTFLTRQQVDRRLKDWFDVLQVKYQVRNLLSEI